MVEHTPPEQLTENEVARVSFNASGETIEAPLVTGAVTAGQSVPEQLFIDEVIAMVTSCAVHPVPRHDAVLLAVVSVGSAEPKADSN